MFNQQNQPQQSGSMFLHPQDEETLCQVLKCLVEEWGPEYVHVSVPEKWLEYGNSSLGHVRLDYTTEITVGIHVRHCKYNVAIDYVVELARA